MRICSQRGATLVIALIMLVLLTLFAISALNTSTTNLKVVGNMQARTEAFNAAQQAIDNVISRTDFVTNPADSVIVNKCGAANTLCIDKDGQITTNLADSYYTTKITGAPFDLTKPACITVRPIKTTELIYTIPDDQNCYVGQKQQFGTAGAVAADSLCANAVYQITAETTAVTGAKATVTQGIGIRISTDVMDTACL
jgi:Tfp pilus assembly protein PilX